MPPVESAVYGKTLTSAASMCLKSSSIPVVHPLRELPDIGVHAIEWRVHRQERIAAPLVNGSS